MGGSTSRDCGIRVDFARSGCTQDEWLYALDALQHSSQCHAHPRKCAGRSEGERSRLFALGKELDLRPGATAPELQSAMHDHILEQAELMGTYAKTKAKSA